MIVEVPGARLNCAGEPGAAAVLLHGFGGDLQTWDGVVAALPGLATLRYDLRGFGGSAAVGHDEFSHAGDLLALLDTRKARRADVIGLSMGGAVALNFALDHPDRVRRLVLVSPSILGWEWSPEWRALWRPMVAAARAGDMAGARRHWFAHPLFETTRAGPAAALLVAQVARFGGDQWLGDRQRAVTPDLERLHKLAAPVLLLTGEFDLPDFCRAADLVAASVPDVLRIDMPGLGHMLPLDDPGSCARAIADFLA